MVKLKKKTGSNVIVPCPVCGKDYTRAGLIGHMRFKHGRDHKAPMIAVDRPFDIKEARSGSDLLNRQLPPTPCCQAKFKLVSASKTGDYLALWKCDSCGSLWKDTLCADIEHKDKDYLVFSRKIERQP